MFMINQKGDLTDEDEMEEALDNEINHFLLGKDDKGKSIKVALTKSQTK